MNNKLLTELEIKFYLRIKFLVKKAFFESLFSSAGCRTSIQFFSLLLVSWFKPEKFLTFLDGYAPGMPYSKYMRSLYCYEQIEDLNEPFNLIFLGAGLDIRWFNAFTYDKNSNRLIHKNSSIKDFEIILIDNSEKQNEILKQSLEFIYGAMPQNIRVQTLDLKSANWSKDLKINEKIKTRFHANGVLPYFNDEDATSVIKECFSFANSHQAIVTFLVESKKVQDLTSQSAAKKIQEESSNQGEQLLFCKENEQDLAKFVNDITNKISEKKVAGEIIFNAHKLVEEGKIKTYKYPDSDIAMKLKKAGIEPAGEVLVSFTKNA